MHFFIANSAALNIAMKEVLARMIAKVLCWTEDRSPKISITG
jgi:hypothetical protein